MQAFIYTAKTKEGELQKGEVEAENESAAAKVLMSRELTPVSVFREDGQSLNLFNRISAKDKALIARQLATMVNAGLPIAQSLKTLQEQIQKTKIKKVLEQVSGDVEGGATLSSSFARFPEMFSGIEITLIASGETSGSLDKSLLRLADQLEKEQTLMRKVRGALIYPAFLTAVVIIVVAVMIVYVMPQMEGLYSSFNAKLPLLTRILIGVSHFMSKFAPWLILALIGFVLYIIWAIRRPWGRRIWDKLKLSTPAINELLKKMYMARFSRTLAALVGSGVPLLDSLSIVSKAIGNVVYEELIQEAAEKVKSGIALSEPLKENPLYPPIVSQMVSVGEKTGELDNMLNKLADYFEEEVDTLVKNISNLIEPVMIVVLGGLIGVILIAIMMPIYSLGSVLFGK